MNEIVSADNLISGIRYWRQIKPHWEKDFGNDLYIQLREWKTSGLNVFWWDRIQPVIKDWKAYRPLSMDTIKNRGLERLPEMNLIHSSMLLKDKAEQLDLETANWSIVSDLFNATAKIKDALSPVFPSKVCHFIFPNIYPVADQEVLGVSGFYRHYWENCSQLWTGSNIQDKLINVLRQEILSSNIQGRQDVKATLSSHFPWSTKITELCLIGNRQR